MVLVLVLTPWVLTLCWFVARLPVYIVTLLLGFSAESFGF